MTFINQPEIISKYVIRVPKNISEQFFSDMLAQISSGLNIGNDELPIDMKCTIDAMMKHKVPNEYLEVQYSVTDNQKKLFVATTNPNYSDLYWNNEQTKSWVENSIGIEDIPEKIVPIINDISNKASLEYSNYIESKMRLENKKSSIFR